MTAQDQKTQDQETQVRITYFIFNITDGSSDTSETKIEVVHLADIKAT